MSSVIQEQIGNERFQNALGRRAQRTPPIWLMRQAGRYHRHYQTLRAQHSFMDLCKRPELAAEVALGPVLDFGFDAAILFSDLLFPLEALGMGLEYTDHGPQLGWKLDANSIARLQPVDDAWPHLLSRHPDAVLAVAGDGDDRPRLEARAAALGLANAVRFLGRVDDRQLDELYRSCRLFVMPSRDEGFGLVFVEAMRAGKPCIGGRGAASEIIEHGVTGLIVGPDSRHELSAALERLYSEPDTCDQFGAAGRERFLSSFTDDGFRALFMTIIARRPLVALAASTL